VDDGIRNLIFQEKLARNFVI